MEHARQSRNTGPKRKVKALAKELNLSYQQAQQIMRSSQSDRPPVKSIRGGRYEALETYPSVVWGLQVDAPDNVAVSLAGETTDRIAHEVAASHGCVYEYCVDDDEYGVGESTVKYFLWYVVVPMDLHPGSRVHPDSPPPVLAALREALIEVLPDSLAVSGRWSAQPEVGPSYQLAAENYCDRIYVDLLSTMESRVEPVLREGFTYRHGLSIWNASRTGMLIVTYNIYLHGDSLDGPSIDITAGLSPDHLTAWPTELEAPGRPVLLGPRPIESVSWTAQIRNNSAGGPVATLPLSATPPELVERIENVLRAEHSDMFV